MTSLAHGSGASFGAGLLGRANFALSAMSAPVGALLQKDVRILAGLAEAAGVKQGTVIEAADAAPESLGRPR